MLLYRKHEHIEDILLKTFTVLFFFWDRRINVIDSYQWKVNIPPQSFFLHSDVRLIFDLPLCNARLFEEGLSIHTSKPYCCEPSSTTLQNWSHLLALAPGEFVFSRHFASYFFSISSLFRDVFSIKNRVRADALQHGWMLCGGGVEQRGAQSACGMTPRQRPTSARRVFLSGDLPIKDTSE